MTDTDKTISRYLNTNFDIVRYVSNYVPELVVVSNYVKELDALLEPTYYLGPKASDPTVDNVGGILLVGAMYYNTAEQELRTWNGSSWDNPLSYNAMLQKASNLSDLTNIVIARTNLGLGSAALEEASTFATAADLTTVQNTANSAIQPNTSPTLTDITASTVTTGTIQLSGGADTQGTLSWNTDEETLDLIQNGAILQVGQEIHYHVRNNSGLAISNGTAVMATGTLGASGRITIAPMDGSTPANAKYFLGIATEDIPDGDDGKITHFGKVRGIDTTAWGEGNLLWIDPNNAGQLTATEPTNGIKIPTAITINSKTNGTIFVRATNGHALHESNDVVLTALADGESLVWDAATSRWVNSNVVGTNISISIVGDTIEIRSSSGLDDTLSLATTTTAGAMSAADKTKLDGLYSNVSHTMSDGSASGSLTVQEAFDLEQTKVIYGGNY